MGENSKIGWTHHTFNPWAGCVEVSPACDFCFARADTKRYGFCEWGKDAARRITSDSYWKQPLKWNRDACRDGVRSRVFCGSWCDVMEYRPELQRWREELYVLIEETQYLDWLLLTKRPQNFRRFLPETWLSNPRRNVWGMTTVESSVYKWREKALLDTPFAVRGLSMEPLLGPVDIDPRIDWVIAGGESGPHARPSHPDWFRSLRDQCAAAGVSFFFKQWGEWTQREAGHPDKIPMIRLTALGRDGQDLANAEDGNEVWVNRIGKKAAGELLDGREWREVPASR